MMNKASFNNNLPYCDEVIWSDHAQRRDAEGAEDADQQQVCLY